MKVVLLFVSIVSAAVINRDTGTKKVSKTKIWLAQKDYYEYDPIERVYTTDDIELGPVDAKAMMSSDTVRVPVGQLRVSFSIFNFSKTTNYSLYWIWRCVSTNVMTEAVATWNNDV